MLHPTSHLSTDGDLRSTVNINTVTRDIKYTQRCRDASNNKSLNLTLVLVLMGCGLSFSSLLFDILRNCLRSPWKTREKHSHQHDFTMNTDTLYYIINTYEHAFKQTESHHAHVHQMKVQYKHEKLYKSWGGSTDHSVTYKDYKVTFLTSLTLMFWTFWPRDDFLFPETAS